MARRPPCVFFEGKPSKSGEFLPFFYLPVCLQGVLFYNFGSLSHASFECGLRVHGFFSNTNVMPKNCEPVLARVS